MNKLLWLELAIKELKGDMNMELYLTLDTPIADLGLDSLDIVELQMMYEETVGYDTPDEMPEPFETVRDLLTLMV